MENEESVTELLEYLQDIVDRASKVPMSGKVMVDRKEVLNIIDQIVNTLPDSIKKAEWIVNERERLLLDARKESDSVKEEAITMLRQNLENHDIVKEAKIRGQEIVAAAKRDSKQIRVGAREYADEILSDLDKEMEKRKMELIKSLQISFEDTAREIDDNLTKACSIVRDNIKELRTMK